MKINRMSSSMSAPDWAFDGRGGLDNSDFTHVSNQDYKRISRNIASEEDLVEERSVIEKCASSGKPYFLNGNWGDGVRSSLREYAIVCGMKNENYREVDLELLEIVESSEEKEMVKVASTLEARREILEARREKKEMSLQDAIGDPFNLSNVSDDRSTTPNREDWEKVEPQHRLAEKPIMMTNAIIPIGGGENYNTNSDVNPARGQNSITDPGAIERMANEDTPDVASELRRINEERANKAKNERAASEAEIVKSMSEDSRMQDGAPRGSVFLTETMDAQPGLGSSSREMGVYSDFDPASLPEKTEGERIADSNEERRRSIMSKESLERENSEHEFRPQGSANRQISETFTDELKKLLGK